MMKKLLLFALPLLAMLSVSCEKDNRDNHSGTTKLVKEIWLETGGKKELKCSFSYDDNGRISGMSYYYTYDGSDNYNYTYSDNTIIETYEKDNSKKTYHLDNNKYIVKVTSNYANVECVYKNGVLTQKNISSDSDGDYTEYFSWKNGNVITDGYGRVEYSNIENVTNLDQHVLFDYASTYLLPFKWKGASSRNWALKIYEREELDMTLEYHLDKDGAPIQIVADYLDGDKSTYTITYVE